MVCLIGDHEVSHSKSDFDTPWQTILEDFFEQFVAFCLPTLYHKIDWEKGYTMLDKELKKISKDSEMGNRIVDKLIKIYTKEGEEKWILIHIEVQGRPEAGFSERMYVYQSRIFSKYGRPVLSLAILTDGNKNWRPDYYQSSLWGCFSIKMTFPIIKVLDYRSRIEELEASQNPFAMVILAQLAALEKNKPEQKIKFKIHLTRNLYSRGWKKDEILKLYTFLDWILELPSDYEIQYHQEVEKMEEEMSRPYITTAERIGIRRGESTFLEHLLQSKFHAIPAHYQEMLTQANSDKLLRWGEKVLVSKTVEEVFSE